MKPLDFDDDNLDAEQEAVLMAFWRDFVRECGSLIKALKQFSIFTVD